MEKMYAWIEKRSARFVATKPSRSFLNAIRTSCRDLVLSGSSIAANIEVDGPLDGMIEQRAFNVPLRAEDAGDVAALAESEPGV